MRTQNWPHALAEYLRARQDMAFEWGVHDCAQFAAGAVDVQTGRRPALPRYRSATGAARLLRERALRERASATLGPEIQVARAQRGDLVLAAGIDGPALGVCMGEVSWFPGKPSGLVARSTIECATAWRVDDIAAWGLE